jgi:phosphoglycolate phosphatase-like HAD superfamily hydrolase
MSSVTISGNRHARLWLFDFDNTLAALEREVDWAASRGELESFLRAEGVDDDLFREFPSRNLPLYNALLVRLLPCPDGEVVKVPGRAHGAELMRRASAIIEGHELRGVDRAAPLPGATKLLRALAARRNPIAIVTSNSSRTVIRWLEQHQLLAQVSAIVGRDTFLPLKPAPEMIVRALELCASIATDTVLVGDSEADVRAAQRAQVGFFGIAASDSASARLNELGAAEVFASPDDLAASLGLADLLGGGLADTGMGGTRK